jgi:hypothetical protein
MEVSGQLETRTDITLQNEQNLMRASGNCERKKNPLLVPEIKSIFLGCTAID